MWTTPAGAQHTAGDQWLALWRRQLIPASDRVSEPLSRYLGLLGFRSALRNQEVFPRFCEYGAGGLKPGC